MQKQLQLTLINLASSLNSRAAKIEEVREWLNIKNCYSA